MNDINISIEQLKNNAYMSALIVSNRSADEVIEFIETLNRALLKHLQDSLVEQRQEFVELASVIPMLKYKKKNELVITNILKKLEHKLPFVISL